jgi:hypothetical protein
MVPESGHFFQGQSHRPSFLFILIEMQAAIGEAGAHGPRTQSAEMADVSSDAGGPPKDPPPGLSQADHTPAASFQQTDTDYQPQYDAIDTNIEALIEDDFEDDFRRRTLTVRLRGGLEEKQDKVAIEINKHHVFEYIDRGPSTLRLTFHSREAADVAANKTIVVDGIRLTLWQPSAFEPKTIHLHGIPLAMEKDVVGEFLKSKGYAPVCPGHICLFDKEKGQKTEIKTPGAR